ncbi:MAG: hypothetical protein IPN28_03860 [Alphaproteobacteria bacterium]|nr:MAG: hypothetical protein IPN28_03860 [Alphaproteobacteria bacterium]
MFFYKKARIIVIISTGQDKFLYEENMLNKFGLTMLVFLGMALWPIPSFAQEESVPLQPTLQAPQYPDVLPYSELACKNYEEKISYIYKGSRRSSTMGPLRVMYSRCPYYDPFGEETLRSMLKLSEMAKSKDPLEAINSIKDYKNLVRKHLANLSVVQMAMEISREDSRYGDPDFFREVKKMITESLTEKKGDGTELYRPVKITTMGEQDYIVSKQDGKVEKSEIIEANGIFYNIYDFVASDKKTRYSLFLDITTPMSAIKSRSEELEKSRKLDLNVQ